MASDGFFHGPRRHVRFFLLFACFIITLTSADAWSIVPNQQSSKAPRRNSFLKARRNGAGEGQAVQPQNNEVSRRRLLQNGILFSVLSLPQSTRAATETPDGEQKEGVMTASTVADLLRPIPTFTIVDEKGIPFTVVGEDAKVTGYFFTTYTEAARILKLARTSADKGIAKAKADKEEEIGTNPWKSARISTVPLDYAVTVIFKSQREKGVYFKMAPAEDDVEDALAVTGDEDLAEGKVPLFYYEDFKILQGEEQKSPLYFRKDELQKEWSRLNPKTEPPKLMVTELISVIMELVRPGGTDDELRSLLFVTPKESESKRKECLKKGGKEPAFVVGKRIIVL